MAWLKRVIRKVIFLPELNYLVLCNMINFSKAARKQLPIYFHHTHIHVRTHVEDTQTHIQARHPVVSTVQQHFFLTIMKEQIEIRLSRVNKELVTTKRSDFVPIF